MTEGWILFSVQREALVEMSTVVAACRMNCRGERAEAGNQLGDSIIVQKTGSEGQGDGFASRMDGFQICFEDRQQGICWQTGVGIRERETER